jgi:hypothetical protein
MPSAGAGHGIYGTGDVFMAHLAVLLAGQVVFDADAVRLGGK